MNLHTQKLFILLLIPVLFLLNSCGKDSKKSIPDLSNPVVKITYPIANSVVDSKNPITIIGTATDNNLANLSVTVFNVTDTSVFYTNSLPISGAGITINQSYTKYLTKLTNCVLQVVVKDEAGNTTVDSTRFVMLN
jgi:hypothetical protein